MSQTLEQAGYTFSPLVQDRGQAAARGGIIDVWPPHAALPLRLDFFGSTLESIRAFDPTTQHSSTAIALATLTPCTPPEADDTEEPATLLDHLPKNTAICWLRPDTIADHLAQLQELDEAATHITYRELRSRAASIGSAQLFIGAERAHDRSSATPPCENLPVYLPEGPLLPDQYERARKEMGDFLESLSNEGYAILMYFDTEGTREHAWQTLAPRFGPAAEAREGVLSEGAIFPDQKLVLVAESDLYGRRKTQTRRYDPTPSRPQPKPDAGPRIGSADELTYGDLVVHLEHGIGRYEGTREVEFNGKQQEVIAVEYAEKAKLFVPLSHAHFLSRYVGVAGRNVRLHRLGAKRWSKQKEEAEAAVMDMAAGLMDVQAARNLLRGYAFGADTPWQIEFEHAFPFQETVDQIRVVEEVKHDMESTRPMDRLICGDAGYGKTEVAMRAAFKAVMEGKQVCVLVPTTVLAEQHYRTFTERMSGYPVRVECLSRFTSTRQRRIILEGMAEGAVDVVIGTHTLVQKGIRFADLGLVMIDEEQRFGVKHKERLKQLKKLVDVLTLSATPIPRTLYMSMTGVRDMSLLRTPPRERMPIETIVTKDADEAIRKAIRRELARDGQVYFLHNRVMSIEIMRTRLEQLLPKARIAVAHGQMPSRQLADVMQHFTNREVDVLLCTTIIESGVDIPRANTIIIDRADRFGLADLYQLRGRVGRSNRKAYAHLLLPAHGHIDSEARERIKAIRRFSALGAGFGLAMRDLELRGAGNILGAAQSGHIAAVGFGLYCQLLKRAVSHLQGNTPAPLVETEISFDALHLAPDSPSPHNSATIPYSYIEEEQIRIRTYRRLAEASLPSDIETLREELRDRFGALPIQTDRLLRLTELRVKAAARHVRRVDIKGTRAVILHKGQYLTSRGRFPNLKGTTIDEQIQEVSDIIEALAAPPPAPPPAAKQGRAPRASRAGNTKKRPTTRLQL
jgi:transcription-repair coupling factor (superfamily II helicase)